MLASDLITIIRADFLYDVVAPYRWSDSFLLRSIIEAEKEACRRWSFIYDDSTPAIATIDLIDGVASYQLSQRITKIEDIVITYPYSLPTISPTRIKKQSKIELDSHDPQWRTNTGIVSQSGRNPYCIIRNQTIRFTPIPTASLDATYLLTVSGTPTTGQTWWDGAQLWQWNGTGWILNPLAPLAVVNLETYRLPLLDTITTGYTPEIPEEHHRELIYWVLYKCYTKRDIDAAPGTTDQAANYTTAISYDVNLALNYLKLFDQAFGTPVSASMRQNQMEEDQVAVFRPFSYEAPLTKRSRHDGDEW